MTVLSRWLAPVVLAAGLGGIAMIPAPAHARDGDDLARVLVDVADVIFRSGSPYYRHGNYERGDRLIVARDRYGRPVYYRQVHRGQDNYGQYRSRQARGMKCNKHGKCKASYYDPRYERDRYSRYDRDRRDDRNRWQARDWRDDDRRWDD